LTLARFIDRRRILVVVRPIHSCGGTVKDLGLFWRWRPRRRRERPRMPDGITFVLTSSNARGGVLSAKSAPRASISSLSAWTLWITSSLSMDGS
jgi:hypothetical protein